MSSNYISSKFITKFPRFMMCRFSQPENPTLDDYVKNQDEIDIVIKYFEIEILSVENHGFDLLIRSNDNNIDLSKYKDLDGNIYLNWDNRQLHYVSNSIIFTIPWSNINLFNNIVLLPEKNVSVKSRIQNVFSKNLKSSSVFRK